MSNGASDIVVAKYSSTGAKQWGVYFGSSAFETSNAVVVTSANELFIVGTTMSTTVSKGGKDVILAKLLTSTGAVQWIRRYGGEEDDEITSIVANSDSVLMVGASSSPEIVNAGSNDMLVMRVASSDGALQWGYAFGGNSIEFGRKAALLSSSNLLVLGDGKSTGLTSAASDILLLQVNPSNGAVSKVEYFGGDDNDFAKDMAISDSVAYVGGETSSFGLSHGFSDIFVMAYDPVDGSLKWCRYYGSNIADESLASLVVSQVEDRDGVYLVGS